jgi:hypothetical protein
MESFVALYCCFDAKHWRTPYLLSVWPQLVRRALDNREEGRIRFFALAPRLNTKVLPIPSFNCFLPVPLA